MQVTVKEKSEFPMDAKPDGIIVMPVNLQGLMEFGTTNRRFRHEFPETFKAYVKECVYGDVFAGDVKVYKEGTFTIALLFYKTFEIGPNKEVDLKLDLQLCQCLTKLFNRFPEKTKFYSPVLPYKNAQVKIVHNKNDYEWVIIREDGIV